MTFPLSRLGAGRLYYLRLLPYARRTASPATPISRITQALPAIGDPGPAGHDCAKAPADVIERDIESGGGRARPLGYGSRLNCSDGLKDEDAGGEQRQSCDDQGEILNQRQAEPN